MPRTRIVTRQAKREKADQEEKVRLTQIKIDAVLEQVDELEMRAKTEVETQIKLIHARTNTHLIEMKMSEFLNMKLKYFTDYKWKVPEPPTSRARSTDRGRSRTPQTSLLPRSLIQSMDRGHFKRGRTPQKVPPMAFLRFPRAGELVLSSGGSPLAVQTDRRENCADVHIPTKKGVFMVNPLKMKQVNREVLMQLDSNVLNQVKTLKSNLEVIVDMATKMGKM
ncbi:borealin-like [Drosophila miranda]|uniref:borealin-like n=1 Tax=Drosophila miranda TaxID=7229 RepID=UPI0007E659FA|nr:borealin-like [Drosophila miranda]XP_033249209.1 borealin-like [Drosophila miranda]